jgi:hypothetical protein
MSALLLGRIPNHKIEPTYICTLAYTQVSLNGRKFVLTIIVHLHEHTLPRTHGGEIRTLTGTHALLHPRRLTRLESYTHACSHPRLQAIELDGTHACKNT